jgi:hypothetical protein
VLFSGTLGAKQGLGVLLDAATRLSDQRHLPFAVAGEGPAKADLIAKYDTLPTLPTVHFLPFPALAACRTETLRLNAEGDFAVVGFRLALDRTLIPV